MLEISANGGVLEKWRYMYCRGGEDEQEVYRVFDAIATDLAALAQTPYQQRIARLVRDRADRFLSNRSIP
jgi:hypothetical protein